MHWRISDLKFCCYSVLLNFHDKFQNRYFAALGFLPFGKHQENLSGYQPRQVVQRQTKQLFHNHVGSHQFLGDSRKVGFFRHLITRHG